MEWEDVGADGLASVPPAADVLQHPVHPHVEQVIEVERDLYAVAADDRAVVGEDGQDVVGDLHGLLRGACGHG